MARLAAPAAAAAVSGLIALATVFGHSDDTISSDASPIDNRDASLPRFRLADVRRHDASSDRPWVTHEDKVYDITDWVPAHPGGDVILRAAGGSIDPYWDIFKIHKSAHVYEVLAQFQIGLIDAADLVDGRPPAESIEDPFEADPVRDPRLITHTAKPRNAEPPSSELEQFFTPNELFYVRNHMWVPVVAESEADGHVVTVELPDGETVAYTLADLRTRFRVHRVAAVLQCSGNRRNDMTRRAGQTNGLQWGVGAISNAVWEGVRLADLLADAGLPVSTDSDFHVQFSGLEAYGASIPLATALDPRADVLLAFGMNGAPLPRDHGFPLRAVVPGHVAARSVKWLSRIVVADEESPSQWQRRDYKAFGPNEGANPDWDRAPAIQEMPVTSAITGVRVQAAETAGLSLRGYAYSGGRAICRVDVSLDGGKTWDQAELLDDDAGRSSRPWTWKRWRYAGTLGSSTAAVVVKATDEAYNTQPETHASIYNARGNLATAWHRVWVCPVRRGGDVVWETYGCGFGKEEARRSEQK